MISNQKIVGDVVLLPGTARWAFERGPLSPNCSPPFFPFLFSIPKKGCVWGQNRFEPDARRERSRRGPFSTCRSPQLYSSQEITNALIAYEDT